MFTNRCTNHTHRSHTHNHHARFAVTARVKAHLEAFTQLNDAELPVVRAAFGFLFKMNRTIDTDAVMVRYGYTHPSFLNSHTASFLDAAAARLGSPLGPSVSVGAVVGPSRFPAKVLAKAKAAVASPAPPVFGTDLSKQTNFIRAAPVAVKPATTRAGAIMLDTSTEEEDDGEEDPWSAARMAVTARAAVGTPNHIPTGKAVPGAPARPSASFRTPARAGVALPTPIQTGVGLFGVGIIMADARRKRGLREERDYAARYPTLVNGDAHFEDQGPLELPLLAKKRKVSSSTPDGRGDEDEYGDGLYCGLPQGPIALPQSDTMHPNVRPDGTAAPRHMLGGDDEEEEEEGLTTATVWPFSSGK